jgi:predicted enzyme involved in methoxymalonyl-ACP biosynthesis
MKIAVLSNVNMEPIKRFFPNYYISAFGQFLKDLKDKNSPIWTDKDLDVIWFHFDIDLEDPEFINILKYQLLPHIEELAQDKGSLIIFSELTFPQFSLEHFFREKKFLESIENFNNELRSLSKAIPNFLLLSTEYIIRKVGYKNYFNENFWYAGRIKYSIETFEKFAKEVKRIYKAYKGISKKVLILDLDNTLWGGVIGEDGLNGILLSEDGKGKIFRDFQKSIKRLKDLGVLLCIVSKNNYSDVMEVFEKHPLMILKLDDFILKKNKLETQI